MHNKNWVIVNVPDLNLTIIKCLTIYFLIFRRTVPDEIYALNNTYGLWGYGSQKKGRDTFRLIRPLSSVQTGHESWAVTLENGLI